MPALIGIGWLVIVIFASVLVFSWAAQNGQPIGQTNSRMPWDWVAYNTTGPFWHFVAWTLPTIVRLVCLVVGAVAILILLNTSKIEISLWGWGLIAIEVCGLIGTVSYAVYWIRNRD